MLYIKYITKKKDENAQINHKRSSH